MPTLAEVSSVQPSVVQRSRPGRMIESEVSGFQEEASLWSRLEEYKRELTEEQKKLEASVYQGGIYHTETHELVLNPKNLETLPALVSAEAVFSIRAIHYFRAYLTYSQVLAQLVISVSTEQERLKKEIEEKYQLASEALKQVRLNFKTYSLKKEDYQNSLNAFSTILCAFLKQLCRKIDVANCSTDNSREIATRLDAFANFLTMSEGYSSQVTRLTEEDQPVISFLDLPIDYQEVLSDSTPSSPEIEEYTGERGEAEAMVFPGSHTRLTKEQKREFIRIFWDVADKPKWFIALHPHLQLYLRSLLNELEKEVDLVRNDNKKEGSFLGNEPNLTLPEKLFKDELYRCVSDPPARVRCLPVAANLFWSAYEAQGSNLDISVTHATPFPFQIVDENEANRCATLIVGQVGLQVFPQMERAYKDFWGSEKAPWVTVNFLTAFSDRFGFTPWLEKTTLRVISWLRKWFSRRIVETPVDYRNDKEAAGDRSDNNTRMREGKKKAWDAFLKDKEGQPFFSLDLPLNGFRKAPGAISSSKQSYADMALAFFETLQLPDSKEEALSEFIKGLRDHSFRSLNSLPIQESTLTPLFSDEEPSSRKEKSKRLSFAVRLLEILLTVEDHKALNKFFGNQNLLKAGLLEAFCTRLKIPYAPQCKSSNDRRQSARIVAVAFLSLSEQQLSEIVQTPKKLSEETKQELLKVMKVAAVHSKAQKNKNSPGCFSIKNFGIWFRRLCDGLAIEGHNPDRVQIKGVMIHSYVYVTLFCLLATLIFVIEFTTQYAVFELSWLALPIAAVAALWISEKIGNEWVVHQSQKLVCPLSDESRANSLQEATPGIAFAHSDSLEREGSDHDREDKPLLLNTKKL